MPEEPEPTPEEWAEIEAADAYLDAVGNRRDFEGDQLGATEWRKDVDGEPINWSRFPSETPGGTKMPPTAGGSPGMSISEDAAQVAQLAQDQAAQGKINAARQHLDDALDALAGASDDVTQNAGQAAQLLGGAEGDLINGQGQQVAGALTELSGQIQAAKQGADNALGLVNAFNAALRDAAQKHGSGS